VTPAALSSLLVVDDAAEIRTLFRTAFGLDHPNVDLAVADSAEEALRVVSGWRPDAVVVDAVMPGMDGIELIRRLRPVLPEAHIVMFSSVSHGRLASEAVAAGANDFIEKSEGLDALLRALGLAS